jgi:hypothetical protein
MQGMFPECSHMIIERVEAQRLASVLAASPIWARLALTSANPRLVERAAETMAAIVIHRLSEPEPPCVDEAQMMLPIG